MDRQRGYMFLKIILVYVTIMSYLFVYTNRLYGHESSSSRIVQPWEQEQNTNRVQTSQPSSQTQQDPSFLVATEERSSGKPFTSPFIIENQEGTLGDTGKLREQLLGMRVNSTAKTFAVMVNCNNAPPGCFENLRISTQDCHYSNCRQTDNVEIADVVVFFTFRMDKEEMIPKFHRPPQQRWVMWTQEPPNRREYSSMLDLPSLKGQFNWTMTQRLDSDIVDSYGRLERQSLPPKNYMDIVRGKKFPIAWFVSHCRTNSSRENYVRIMQKVVDVHIFGTCGSYNCTSGNNRRLSDNDVCFPMLSKSYYFYLAFENAFCKDYVTEKFFKIFSGADVIPVVRGGADYKRFFPPNTFIDASDFQSPKELAKFLIYLSMDKERYLSMLIEKSRYRYVPPRDRFCDLCEKMLTDDKKKWYPDVRTWFIQDQCHEPTDLIE